MSDTDEKGPADTEESPKGKTTPRRRSGRNFTRKSNSTKTIMEKESDTNQEEDEINHSDAEEKKLGAVNGDTGVKTATEGAKDNSEAENDVPELDDAPPPTITTTPTNAPRTLKLRTSLSVCENEESEEKKNDDNQIPEEFTVVEEVESDSDDVQEVPVDKMEVDIPDTNKTSPHAQTLEEMTVIDEVTDDSEKKDLVDSSKQENNLEPDTEMVSEDELPAEVNKEPETEAVSDEELPTSGDLPDTEAVSEDELPPEGSDKKKKKRKFTPSKDSSGTSGKKDGEGSTTKKESAKRKLAEGEYDPSSPTSEASDDSPAAKKAATDGKSVKPKVLPELEKYWKAVKEDATDFTGWTYLLQYVDQENEVDAAREAYDAFLSHYPYCYGYWRKYADYEKRKGNKEKCEELEPLAPER